jgi:hypothetical protein
MAPDALDSLTPEERHDFYKMVRLGVVIYPNCDLEISWAGGEGLLFSTSESVPDCPAKARPTLKEPRSTTDTLLGAGALVPPS